jgi:hypothetical protein
MAVPAQGASRDPARSSPGHQNWSFESAREPARFTAALQSGTSGPDHAYGADATLCGIPKEQTVTCRHLFQAASPRACRQCRDRAAAAPAIPSAQEQLYNKVLTAEPGPLRGHLLALLRGGAKIRLWINGPAGFLGQHYLDIGSITREPKRQHECPALTSGSGLLSLDTLIGNSSSSSPSATRRSSHRRPAPPEASHLPDVHGHSQSRSRVEVRRVGQECVRKQADVHRLVHDHCGSVHWAPVRDSLQGPHSALRCSAEVAAVTMPCKAVCRMAENPSVRRRGDVPLLPLTDCGSGGLVIYKGAFEVPMDEGITARGKLPSGHGTICQRSST